LGEKERLTLCVRMHISLHTKMNVILTFSKIKVYKWVLINQTALKNICRLNYFQYDTENSTEEDLRTGKKARHPS
jgi:hypothetical protein